MSDITPPLLLLVEDESLILMDVAEVLKEAGFEIVPANDATSALLEIEADCSRFSALVTDIDLGKGPSGWEVARRARQINHLIPVIYMSGASYGDWSAQGVPKSVMIPKPFAPAQIVTAVATLVNEAALALNLS